MKISYLKKILDEYPDDYEVILSKDGEGNTFSPCVDTGEVLYVPENTYSGEVYPTPEQIATSNGYYGEEDDVSDDPTAQRAIVLWPTN